jgi:hypothetical protein
LFKARCTILGCNDEMGCVTGFEHWTLPALLAASSWYMQMHAAVIVVQLCCVACEPGHPLMVLCAVCQQFVRCNLTPMCCCRCLRQAVQLPALTSCRGCWLSCGKHTATTAGELSSWQMRHL